MKPLTVSILISLVVVVAIVGSTDWLKPSSDNQCTLEDVSNEEIINSAQSILYQLNKSESLRGLELWQVTWYFHNEPDKISKYLNIWWRFLD